MKYQEIINNCMEKQIGRLVYFMADNLIHSGLISGFDDFQIFVDKTHGLGKGRVFFYSLEDMLLYLRDNEPLAGQADKDCSAEGAVETIQCPDCDGAGCGGCEGDGFDCPTCNGTGQINEPMAGPGDKAGFGRASGCVALPPANEPPNDPHASYLCEDCGEPDWVDTYAGGPIRKFYRDSDGCTICDKCHNAPLTDRRNDAGSVKGVVGSSDMSDPFDKSDGLTT